ncbi:hypothetical protein ABK040_009656 [Willaertia magna]
MFKGAPTSGIVISFFLLFAVLSFTSSWYLHAEFNSLNELIELNNETDYKGISFELKDLSLMNKLIFRRQQEVNEDAMFRYNFTLNTYTKDDIPIDYFRKPVPQNNNGFVELEPLVLFKLNSLEITPSPTTANDTTSSLVDLYFYSDLSSGIFNIDTNSLVLYWFNPLKNQYEEWKTIGGAYFNYTKSETYSFRIPVSNIVQNSRHSEFIFSLMGYEREIQVSLNEMITINSPGNVFIKLDNTFTLQYQVNKMILGDPLTIRMDKQHKLPVEPPLNYVVLNAMNYLHISGSNNQYNENKWFLLRDLDQTAFTDYTGKMVDIDVDSITFARQLNDHYHVMNFTTREGGVVWIKEEKQLNVAIVAKLKNPIIPDEGSHLWVLGLFAGGAVLLASLVGITILVVKLRNSRKYQIV